MPPPRDLRSFEERGRELEALERLGDEIAALVSHLHAATYRLLVMLREFDAGGGWDPSFKTCAHWLSWRTGIGPGAAREKVRVARALGELPLISDAMRRGELSYSKARALTRVATPANEAVLVEFARHATAAHVERLVAGWQTVDRLEEEARERERHAKRELWVLPQPDGSYLMRGRLDPEVGAVVVKALQAADEQLYPDYAARREVLAEQRRADALGMVADGALGKGMGGQASRADRFQVVVHVQAEALAAPREDAAGTLAAASECAAAWEGVAGKSEQAEEVAVAREHKTEGPATAEGAAAACEDATEGRAVTEDLAAVCEDAAEGAATPEEPAVQPSANDELPPIEDRRIEDVRIAGGPLLAESPRIEGGPRVSAETSRRLACDAGRVDMTHAPDGSVLDVGRKTRTTPPAIRRALEHRDGGCRFPGCTSGITDAHHIRHWADGGETRLDNLTLLCRRHHRAVHEGGFAVEVSPEGRLRFSDPDGRVLLDAPEPPPAPEDPVGALVAEHERAGLEIGPWTATPLWNGERFDLHYAVMVLRTPPPQAAESHAAGETEGVGAT